MEVHMDDYLWDTNVMEAMLLDIFRNDELGNDAHITDTLFKILKYASTTPIFALGGKSKSTHPGIVMFLYNVKEKFDMLNACFSVILR